VTKPNPENCKNCSYKRAYEKFFNFKIPRAAENCTVVPLTDIVKENIGYACVQQGVRL